MKKGFTLIELLVVIAILGVLSSMIIVSLTRARSSAAFARAQLEFRTLITALELYLQDHDYVMPPDVERNLPPGLETYLTTDNWPNAPWPGSYYDWENWDDPDHPGQKIYQISIRFCPLSQPDSCRFPEESWADNFDYYSSVYYCIQGACRAHSEKPINYPGYCVNCPH